MRTTIALMVMARKENGTYVPFSFPCCDVIVVSAVCQYLELVLPNSANTFRGVKAKLTLAYVLLAAALALQCVELVILSVATEKGADIAMMEPLIASGILAALAGLSAYLLYTGRGNGVSYWTLMGAIPLVLATGVILVAAPVRAFGYDDTAARHMLPLLIPPALWMVAYVFACRQRYLLSLHRVTFPPTAKPSPKIAPPPPAADTRAALRLARIYAWLAISLTAVWVSCAGYTVAIWRLDLHALHLMMAFMFFAALAVLSANDLRSGGGKELSLWSLILMFPYTIGSAFSLVDMVFIRRLPWTVLVVDLMFTAVFVAYLLATIQRFRLKHQVWPAN